MDVSRVPSFLWKNTQRVQSCVVQLLRSFAIAVVVPVHHASRGRERAQDAHNAEGNAEKASPVFEV